MSEYVSPSTRPAAYPSDLEVQLPLEDGRTVLVRPVVPDDAPMLVRQLEHADPDTIYQRFFRYPVHLDAETLDHMTRLDYHDRMALAAFAADGEGVAIARYEIIEPGLAEVAVVVQPEWRLLGLGTALLEMLEGAALERGITRFTAIFLPDNRQIASLLERVGFSSGGIDGGLGTASKDLAG